MTLRRTARIAVEDKVLFALICILFLVFMYINPCLTLAVALLALIGYGIIKK